MVDDKRDINVDIIARNSNAARQILRQMKGEISVLILDYDLGEVKTKQSKEITGWDVLQYAIIYDLLPPTVQIISDNPIGRKRLHDALIHDAKYLKQGCNYTKDENGDAVK